MAASSKSVAAGPAVVDDANTARAVAAPVYSMRCTARASPVSLGRCRITGTGPHSSHPLAVFAGKEFVSVKKKKHAGGMDPARAGLAWQVSALL